MSSCRTYILFEAIKYATHVKAMKYATHFKAIKYATHVILLKLQHYGDSFQASYELLTHISP